MEGFLSLPEGALMSPGVWKTKLWSCEMLRLWVSHSCSWEERILQGWDPPYVVFLPFPWSQEGLHPAAAAPQCCRKEIQPSFTSCFSWLRGYRFHRKPCALCISFLNPRLLAGAFPSDSALSRLNLSIFPSPCKLRELRSWGGGREGATFRVVAVFRNLGVLRNRHSVTRMMTKSQLLTVLVVGKSFLTLVVGDEEHWQGILFVLTLPNSCTAGRDLAWKRCW